MDGWWMGVGYTENRDRVEELLNRGWLLLIDNF